MRYKKYTFLCFRHQWVRLPYQRHSFLSQDPVIAWQSQSPPVSLILSRIANICTQLCPLRPLNCEHFHTIVSTAAVVELWTFVRNCWDLIVRTRPDNCEAGQRGRRTCASASACFVAQIHSWEIQLRYMYRWEIHLRYTVEKYIKELVSAPICFSGNTVETTAEHKVENTVEI